MVTRWAVDDLDRLLAGLRLGLTGDTPPRPPRTLRAERPTCGARTRQGRPCRAKAVPGKRRCRLHGGLATGPRTPEGRARIAAAQRARWQAWRAAQGPHPRRG
ncbi:HGGxSTG domain-containing protein [Minwuia thermotolerans]|uniref:Uncharacterized protein n=1 Tax=Minwuia thermotolerans TaxID=2056226 RepID=A0A2M9FZL6_9PROT|nr:HGGxSTG domain-containing protein [Minwuia thermotolerans]PJK28921.1 hypothetical protein CVT23_14950 [Minwuia thermotolerans]